MIIRATLRGKRCHIKLIGFVLKNFNPQDMINLKGKIPANLPSQTFSAARFKNTPAYLFGDNGNWFEVNYFCLT